MRVAYANVRGGVLCLGDPGGRHVRLLVGGIQAVGVVVGATDDADLGSARYDARPGDDDAYGVPATDGDGYDDRFEDDADADDEDDDGPDDVAYGSSDDDRPADGPEDDVPRDLVAWADLAALEIDAPTTRWRYPGVLSTVVAALVGTVGIEWYPEGAGLDVEITTASGVGIVPCDGFAGRGYWTPHARAVQTLLRLLVSDRRARAWLETPGDLLGLVASVARSGPTDEALAVELRVLLEPGPVTRRP